MTKEKEEEILTRALHRLYNEITEIIKEHNTSGVVTREIVEALFRDRQDIINVGKKYNITLGAY